MIRKTLLIIASVFLAFTILGQDRACATPSGACNPEFEEAMEARALLEAMREVEYAQTKILKPDSVLEYTCFARRMEELGTAVDDMFSDNVDSTILFSPVPSSQTIFNPSGRYARFLPTINETQVTAPNNNGGAGVVFGPHPPGGALHAHHMNNVLGIIVRPSLTQYLVGSFGHTYLGGTFGGVASNCNDMSAVWEFAKCVNFIRTDFRRLSTWAAFDPRDLVSYLPLACNNSTRNSNWSTLMAASVIDPDPTTYDGSAALPSPIPPGPQTQLNFINELSNCSALDPVRTGVMVFQGSPPAERFEDAICVAPGCYYNASGTCSP